jgi:hypothetical protein
MGKPMGHDSRAFIPNVNPISTKEQTLDFFMARLFFIDPHKLPYFVHKM